MTSIKTEAVPARNIPGPPRFIIGRSYTLYFLRMIQNTSAYIAAEAAATYRDLGLEALVEHAETVTRR